ncbi:hypothetical protein NVP1121O_110 [Vibrio phage 1.121.O._10N.286.46.C4]|nr:hypothetical protein NVP1121O_110 [Vibrio phage 1.121.O._10N.286.46.C4]
MSIEQQLITKGFKSFTDTLASDKEGYTGSYQLKVWDKDEDKGIAYFINVDLLDYRNTRFASVCPEFMLEDLQGNFEVQFTSSSSSEGETFNVQYLEKDIDKVLAFYDNLYYTLNCTPYGE